MNRHNQRLFIAVGFYLSLAIMVGIGIFSFFSTRGLIHYNQLLNRSLQVHEVLDEMRGLVIEAESAQRGYILTGSNRFLKVIPPGSERYPRETQEVEKLD